MLIAAICVNKDLSFKDLSSQSDCGRLKEHPVYTGENAEAGQAGPRPLSSAECANSQKGVKNCSRHYSINCESLLLRMKLWVPPNYGVLMKRQSSGPQPNLLTVEFHSNVISESTSSTSFSYGFRHTQV